MTVNSSKKALSLPVIGSLSLVSWDMVPRAIPLASRNGSVTALHGNGE